MRHSCCAFLLLLSFLVFDAPYSYGNPTEHKSYLMQSTFNGEAVQVKLDNFLSVPNSNPGQSQDLFFAVESMRSFEFNSMNSRWNLGSRYSDLEGLQYWIRELNTEYSKDLPSIQSKFSASVGRFYYTDLKLDSLWGLGAIEPQFRGDPLNPIHQGLTGFSAQMSLGEVNFSVFVSPLGFPDTGVTFNVQDGQIVSNSPWFINAPTTVNFDGQVVNLNYNLNIGSRLDLLVNPSFLTGLSANVYDIDFTLNGGVVPSTQFFLEVDPKARVNENNVSFIEANVQPKLIPKSVLTLKAKKDFRLAKVWAEVFTENHQNIKNNNPEVYQSQISDNTFVSLGFDSKVSFKKMDFDFGFSYLNNTGNKPLNKNNVFRYSNYIFNNAIETHMKLSFFPTKLNVNFNLKYDLDESAFLASPRITYKNEDNIQFYAQYDLIGRPLNPDLNGFLSQQAGNDRLMVGLNYVF